MKLIYNVLRAKLLLEIAYVHKLVQWQMLSTGVAHLS